MFIILPTQPGRKAFDEAAVALQGLDFRQFLKVSPTSVTVQIPRFEISQSLDLTQSLPTLGVRDAFDPSLADLTGISDVQLYVSSAKHQAKIEVDEKGTTASAATEITISTCSLSPMPSFVADRPFIFFIVDNTSGVILFMGNVQQFPLSL